MGWCRGKERLCGGLGRGWSLRFCDEESEGEIW